MMSNLFCYGCKKLELHVIVGILNWNRRRTRFYACKECGTVRISKEALIKKISNEAKKSEVD